MFLHLSVSHSVHGGGGGEGVPEQEPPGTRYTPPGPGIPPRQVHPSQQTATVADGTHPTGMHSY